MRLLVTAGATREPLDAVRYLSNVSTGATGAALAAAWAARGHSVALLRGEGAAAAPRQAGLEEEVFSSAADLGERLRRRLGEGGFDAAVMAAAVADYRPAEAFAGKLASEYEDLTLRLARNPKLLPQLKGFAPKPPAVVGFKLTAGAGPAERRAAVAAQFAAGGVDLVVANDLEEIRRGPGHPFHVYRSPEAEPLECLGARRLAERLERLLDEIPGARKA